MWETIRIVLTSSHATSTLLFLSVCMIGAFVLIKSNMFQIHTNAIQIGAQDAERTIIKAQLDYVMTHLNHIENTLDKPKGYNEYLGRFIIEKAYDEYVQWVTINHLNRSDKYITMKEEQLVAVVGQYTQKPEFKTPEFEEFIRKDTHDTILALIDIREVYERSLRK